jgi:transcriptional regulator with GAF, ATPase, and Fis domain
MTFNSAARSIRHVPGRGVLTVSDRWARDAVVALADVFVALADVPVDEVDVLGALAERCVEVLGVAAAGLLLVDHRGRPDLVAASTEQARLLALRQLRNGEGPCLDCYRGGRAVRCADLAAASARWPRFAPAAAEAGFATVCALPMRLRDEVIGGLTLFTASPGTLDEGVVGLAQALADVATIGILRRRTLRHGELVVEQLQTTLDGRVLVEQAKGMLAERLRISVADAFTLLCDHAGTTNRRVVDLAAMVVEGTSDLAGAGERSRPLQHAARVTTPGQQAR